MLAVHGEDPHGQLPALIVVGVVVGGGGGVCGVVVGAGCVVGGAGGVECVVGGTVGTVLAGAGTDAGAGRVAGGTVIADGGTVACGAVGATPGGRGALVGAVAGAVVVMRAVVDVANVVGTACGAVGDGRGVAVLGGAAPPERRCAAVGGAVAARPPTSASNAPPEAAPHAARARRAGWRSAARVAARARSSSSRASISAVTALSPGSVDGSSALPGVVLSRASGYDRAMDQDAISQAIDRLGTFPALDRVDGPLTRVARLVTQDDRASRWLHGSVIGHRLHPMLTDIPIGAWTAASVLDVIGGKRARPHAQRLVGLGVLSAVPTALAGLADWDGTSGRTRRVGIAHALGNSAAITCSWRSWRARRRGHHFRGVGWSMAGLGAATLAGAIGGHLVYRLGAGVDHDVPVVHDHEWHDVAALDALTENKPHAAAVDDASIALVRRNGFTCALAGTCSHAGGPLGEGSVEHDGLVCPWHGSRFSLDDGAVQRGPAIAPQPVYETRTRDGQVAVRAPEPA
jgi:nitrite reductase/ring-hydroxylating ferredoxin subunit/uncharacterized membrane protein